MRRDDKPPVHAAKLSLPKKGTAYLLLREEVSGGFAWYLKENLQSEAETGLSGASVTEALQKARKHWKLSYFRTLNCGFRFSLPERDEHGCNALFEEMIASYASMQGIYFDQELGHPCIVREASLEALKLWRLL